jgi:NNP family nitrate/nitrite transporter-like MFS transporter
MWLKEPESGFSEEYHVSSVDLQIEEEERQRLASQTAR